MHIVCFGDSITRGYDVPYGLGWVELCAEAMAHTQFTNYGVDGLSVQGLFNRVEVWARAVSYDQNRYIFLMCGTNDILQGRDADYVFRILVKAIEQAAEKGRVIIGLETQIDSDMDGINREVVAINDRLKDYAAKHHHKTIDFYSTLNEADRNGQIVFAGEVHPNELGYRLMSQTALKVFLQLGKREWGGEDLGCMQGYFM